MCERTTFDGVEFDDHIMELLLELSAETGQEPRKLISALVSDVLIDDAIAEGRIAATSHTVQ